VLDAALGIIPGPLSAGIASPFSGRVSARLGKRRTLLAGAALFALAGIWPLLVGGGEVPAYLAAILPSLVLWGVANALIQPTLFGGADAAPTADLALAAAVLAASRQLGSAFGVALLVGLVGATGVASFDAACAIVLVSAVLNGRSRAPLSAQPIRVRTDCRSARAGGDLRSAALHYTSCPAASPPARVASYAADAGLVAS
jgi:predicted MFS family arabinose efflux permease